MSDSNPGFPRTRRRNPYDGVGGWASDSSTPPWGWIPSIAVSAALLAAFGSVLIYGPALMALVVGA